MYETGLVTWDRICVKWSIIFEKQTITVRWNYSLIYTWVFLFPFKSRAHDVALICSYVLDDALDAAQACKRLSAHGYKFFQAHKTIVIAVLSQCSTFGVI